MHATTSTRKAASVAVLATAGLLTAPLAVAATTGPAHLTKAQVEHTERTSADHLTKAQVEHAEQLATRTSRAPVTQPATRRSAQHSPVDLPEAVALLGAAAGAVGLVAARRRHPGRPRTGLA